MTAPSAGSRWSIVVPVKGTDLSKSRLAELPATVAERRRLALAFALDTVEAIRRSQHVGDILVVTDDAESAAALAPYDVLVVPDPGAGLNAAIAAGLTEARRRRPSHHVAAITADLPSLTTPDLDVALALAAEHPASFVADFEGVGTTTITAAPGFTLVPRFGPGSAAAHAADGLAPLALSATSTLRRDVDTPPDVAAGLGGFGPHTRRLLNAEPK